MTKDKFQRETNDFMTRDEREAQALAESYNAIGVDGERIVAVKFGDQWCVMLGGAAEFVREMGI